MSNVRWTRVAWKKKKYKTNSHFWYGNTRYGVTFRVRRRLKVFRVEWSIICRLFHVNHRIRSNTFCAKNEILFFCFFFSNKMFMAAQFWKFAKLSYKIIFAKLFTLSDLEFENFLMSDRLHNSGSNKNKTFCEIQTFLSFSSCCIEVNSNSSKICKRGY